MFCVVHWGKPIGIDRRDQTYQVGDTIHEPVIELENANWTALQNAVLNTPRGERGYERIEITLDVTSLDFWSYPCLERQIKVRNHDSSPDYTN